MTARLCGAHQDISLKFPAKSMFGCVNSMSADPLSDYLVESDISGILLEVLILREVSYPT